MNELLDHLVSLERELHRLETRRDRSRLEALLHPYFQEIGRSGRYYDRNAVLDEFSDVQHYESVRADDFHLRKLADGLALLTYTSAHVGETGELHRHTQRSSIWIRVGDDWQLCFHQGTPVEG